MKADRELVLELISEAVAAGARLAPACEVIGCPARESYHARRKAGANG